MKHEDVKKLLLQNPEFQREYDELKVSYNIKREIIRLRIERGDYNPSLKFLSKGYFV